MTTYFYYISAATGQYRVSENKPDDIQDFVIIRKLDLFTEEPVFELIGFEGGIPQDNRVAYLQASSFNDLITAAQDLMQLDTEEAEANVYEDADNHEDEDDLLEKIKAITSPALRKKDMEEGIIKDAVIGGAPYHEKLGKEKRKYTEAQKLAILMDTELGIHSNISKEILSGLFRRPINSRNELSEKEINLVKRLIRHLQKELGDNKRVVDFLLYASSQQVHNVFSREGFTKLFDAFNSTVAQDELPF